jgi:hypothetical protein
MQVDDKAIIARLTSSTLTFASNAFKELRQGNLKAPGESFDIPKGYVSDSTLNSTVVRSMQPGSFRCLFLVNALLISYPAYGAAEPDADINWHKLASLNIRSLCVHSL